MRLNIAVGEFLEGYFSTNERRDKTREAYITDLGQFETFIGKTTNLLSVKHTDIERWVSHLKCTYSPASVRRKIVTIKVFFSYWIRREVLTESPFWKVKISYGRIEQLPRALTQKEIRDLLGQAKTTYLNSRKVRSEKTINTRSRHYLSLRNLALLELLFATGIRVGEISSINIDDYLSSEAAFKINGKGGKERLAFVVDKVTLSFQNEYLKIRQRVQSENHALFLNAKGNRLSPQGIANVIDQLCTAKCINRNITPHMLRHTVATLLLRNGVDIRVVQEFLDHSSIATTQRYTHVAKEHLIRELQHRHPSLDFR